MILSQELPAAGGSSGGGGSWAPRELHPSWALSQAHNKTGQTSKQTPKPMWILQQPRRGGIRTGTENHNPSPPETCPHPSGHWRQTVGSTMAMNLLQNWCQGLDVDTHQALLELSIQEGLEQPPSRLSCSWPSCPWARSGCETPGPRGTRRPRLPWWNLCRT